HYELDGGALPLPDANGQIRFDVPGGRVALVNGVTALRCESTCRTDPWVRDFVGYGNAPEGEGGTEVPSLSPSTAGLRSGCNDTDNNHGDFTVGSPAPQNAAANKTPCPVGPTSFPQTLLVSRAGPDGAGGDKASDTGSGGAALTLADLTPDGRSATFNTSALNLRPAGTDPSTEPTDVMVRDLNTGLNDVISIPNGPAPNPLSAPLGHGTASDGTAISANRIAFVDDSPDLVTPALDRRSRVWVRDRATGVTQLASQINGVSGTDTSVDAHGQAWAPSISADGRYVAFASTGDNLDAADNNTTADVFLRDLQTNTTTLLSGANGSSAGGNGPSDQPVISADGRFVAYSTKATNIGTCPAPAGGSVVVVQQKFVFRQTVSRGSASGPASGNDTCPNGSAEHPAISADGSRVAFVSSATSFGGNASTVEDVFVRDIGAGTTTLVDLPDGPDQASGHPSNGDNFDPAISPDGNSVAFVSTANDIGPDANARGDIFVRDLNQASTTIVSVPDGPVPAPGGTFGSSPAQRPLGVTNDGRTVTFSSGARNLAPGENPASQLDVFARTSVTAVPLVSTQPSISGDPRVGKTLTCNVGVWTRTPATFKRQWLRNGSAIANQTAATYTLVAADLDQDISCRVTGSNAAGDGAPATTAVVKGLPATPNNLTPPSMSGTPTPNSQLTCAPGTWNGANTVTQRWVRSVGSAQFVAIDNATGVHYTLTQADVGARVACQDVATNNAGTEVAQSNSKTVSTGVPESLERPAITGNPAEGTQLTCGNGLWSNSAMSFTRRWLRDDSPIGGATGVNYTVATADADHRLTCEVIATNDVGASAPATSTSAFAVND
ncbi:MAG: hypothetical protein QOK14_1856, partial [Frankiaceae bacterium]|nr:hypothetical protein [Frankiaceae bacterium]